MDMLRGNYFWKESGCRNDSPTLVTRRKAQKSTSSTIVHSGTELDEDSRGFQKVGAKSENLKGGVEVAQRYCNAASQREANGTGVNSV